MLFERNLLTLPFWVWPYFAMLFIGLMLPSDGNHGLLTPKSLSFLFTFLILIYHSLFVGTLTKYQMKLVVFSFVSISFLLIWMFIGHWQMDRWNESSFDQFKIFAITIATVIMTLNIVHEGLSTRERILKLVIYANFTYSIIKVFAVGLHIVGLINIFKLLDLVGIRYMSMSILNGDLSRLQTSVDIITPFLVLFVLMNRNLGLNFSKLFVIFYLFISIPAIFLSFSRFLYGVTAMSLLLYAFTVNIPGFVRIAIVTLSLTICAVAFIGIGKIELLVYERFFSHDNKMSDQTRIEQISALMQGLEEKPLLGRGLGGYIDSLLRDGTVMHSYEVQWEAFMMQFGMLGFFILLIPVLIIGYKLFLPPFNRVKLAFFGLFGIWLIAGFTNPFLISLTSGIVYSVFILTADILNLESMTSEKGIYE